LKFVQQVLAEHGRGDKIRQALLYGHEAAKGQPGHEWWRRKSTRRGVVWENAVDKLIKLLDGDPRLETIPHHDTISFIFEQSVLVRLKKADFALRSSNVPTEQATLFHCHEADLFGFTGLQRVEAVYVPNRFDTAVIWTGIVARQDRKHLWNLELTEVAGTAAVIEFPQSAPTSAESLARLRAPKEGSKDEENRG
jgi:hypothetical protein